MFPCEKMAGLIPSIRAFIANELLINYNLSQEEVAKILGVSQGAVSQYTRKLRGKEILRPEIRNELKDLCKNLMTEKTDLNAEICNLCKRMTMYI